MLPFTLRIASAVVLISAFAPPVGAQNAPATKPPASPAPAAAQTTAPPGVSAQPPAVPPQPQRSAAQTTLEGRAFGQHVSSMAPEHPLLYGRMFGECVSEVAITGQCPHDHE
jgi:hypothetical protein